MMHISGSKLTLEQTLLARIADELSFQSWAKTKDGQRKRNRPKSILKALTEEKEESVSYTSPEEFLEAWESLSRENNA